MAAEETKKVRIFVVGDPGVGKTCLVHLICHGQVLHNAPSTTGCSVEVKLHDYSGKDYFLEFWDIGGSPNYVNGRAVFYNQIHGIILVHDSTNKKSYENLRKVWLPEVLAHGKKSSSASSSGGTSQRYTSDGDFDPEQFAGENIPVLVVGTKQDQLVGRARRSYSIVADTGSDALTVDCTNAGQFVIGSPHTIKLNHFFDKVIEQRYFPKQASTQVVNAEERASKSATLQRPIDTVGAGLIGGTSSRHGHTNTQQTHQ